MPWDRLADRIRESRLETEKVRFGIATFVWTGSFTDERLDLVAKRDISSPDAAVREAGIRYLTDALDFAAAIGARVVAGPIAHPPGRARPIPAADRAAERAHSVESFGMTGTEMDALVNMWRPWFDDPDAFARGSLSSARGRAEAAR